MLACIHASQISVKNKKIRFKNDARVEPKDNN